MRKESSDKSKRKMPINNIRKARIPKGSLEKSKNIQNEKTDLNSSNQKTSSTIRKNKLIIRLLLVLPILLVVFTVIFIMTHKLTKNNPDSSLDTSFLVSLISEDEIISSLSFATPRLERFNTLQEDVLSFVEEFDGRIGIYYVNLSNEETYGYEEKAPFVAAGSIKLALITQLYKSVAEGKYKLDDNFIYDSRPYPTGDFIAGPGEIAKEANGTKFSVRRTAQLAITVDDNCATYMAIRALGGIDQISPLLSDISNQVPYMKDIKYTSYNGAIQSGKNRTSAYDLAMHAKHLHSLWESDNASYAPLIEDLQQTVFSFGLQAKLPKDVKIAHKIGTNNEHKTENDVGIIFDNEHYILCVTTETELQEKGRDAVAQISLMFYEYITKME